MSLKWMPQQANAYSQALILHRGFPKYESASFIMQGICKEWDSCSPLPSKTENFDLYYKEILFGDRKGKIQSSYILEYKQISPEGG